MPLREVAERPAKIQTMAAATMPAPPALKALLPPLEPVAPPVVVRPVVPELPPPPRSAISRTGERPDGVYGSQAAADAATTYALSFAPKQSGGFLGDLVSGIGDAASAIGRALPVITTVLNPVGALVRKVTGIDPVGKLVGGDVGGAVRDTIGIVGLAGGIPGVPAATPQSILGLPAPAVPGGSMALPVFGFSGAPSPIFSPPQPASGSWYDPLVNAGVSFVTNLLTPKPAPQTPGALPAPPLPNLGVYPMPLPLPPNPGALAVGGNPSVPYGGKRPMASAAPGTSSWQFSVGGPKGVALTSSSQGAMTQSQADSMNQGILLRQIRANTGAAMSLRDVLALARRFGFEQAAAWLGLAVEQLVFLWQRAHSRSRRRLGPHLGTIVKRCRQAAGYKKRLSHALALCGSVGVRHRHRGGYRVQRRRSRRRSR